MIIYEYIIRIKKLEINPKIISVLLGIVLIFSFHSLYKRNISPDLLKNSIYLASVKIAELFSNDTTDTLAMGDRAGIVGYLLKNPIVHLEGIVMDEKYLEFIRKEEDLEKVLKSYNVKYYIATNPKLIGKGCYEFVEPRKAGNHSHRMRAILCQKPVYEFWMGNYHTAIFKVE